MAEARSGNREQIDFRAFLAKNRILLLFAPDEEAPMLAAFRQQLRRRSREVAARDLRVFAVLENGESRLDAMPVQREQACALRKRFSIDRGQSALILIGKDGEVKGRSSLAAGLPAIFASIDAMPMRQAEMRERGE